MKEKHLEEKVGAFVLAGLIVTGILILSFGRFSQLFERSYTIVAEFPNASGIIKNSQVLYRGAKIGTVTSPPRIIKEGEAVELLLKINRGAKIPDNAEFKIGVYGLLGDRFVDIVPPIDASKGEIRYLKDGDHVQGAENLSVGDLLKTAENKLVSFDQTIQDIRSKVLTEEFIHDFHEGMSNAKEILRYGKEFMAKANEGEGPLHVLFEDRETGMNLKQFMYNLRVSGPVFYDDLTDEESKKSEKSELLKKRLDSRRGR